MRLHLDIQKKYNGPVADIKEEQMGRMNIACLRVLAVIVFFPFCLLCAAHASAADENPCAEYIAKFCNDVKPEGMAIMDCLEKHESELSQACKAHEAKMGGKKVEMREEVREKVLLRQACKDDVAKFCRDVAPKAGGIEKCLNDHIGELSPACGERVRAVKTDRKK